MKLYICAKKRRPYLIRIKDGALLDGQKHRSLQGMINKRKARNPEEYKLYYQKTKKLQNKKRVERQHENKKRENERRKNWYYRNHERELFNEIERRIKRYPHRFLNHAISQYRSGTISIDELDRRVNESIERTNGVINKNSNN